MEINEKVVVKDLQRLEQLIDMVNFEYNLYYKGETDNPPTMNENLLKGIINKYRVYQITNPSLRNKYNNLMSKYNSFRSKWKQHITSPGGKDDNMRQLGNKIVEKLKALSVKNSDQLKVLIYNKLNTLIEEGYNINDFDIIIKGNKIEVNIK